MRGNIPWINSDSLSFLQRKYLLPGQTPEQRVEIIAHTAFVDYLKMPELKEEFLDYVYANFYSFSTPIWSNFGTDRGLPISCFGSSVGDSISEIAFHTGEVDLLSKGGGGTSGDWTGIRHRGAPITDNGTSYGVPHFLSKIDNATSVVSQGSTRRGSYAAYLSIDHPDIYEFLNLRSEGNPIQDLSFGVSVTDDFYKRVIDGDKAARDLWARVIEVRFTIGYPYIFNIDNANKARPQWYKDNGMMIKNSNLCTEIMEISDEDRTFVCDLSSMNADKYDEWKDTRAVKLLTYFLDAVMSEFIMKCERMKERTGVHKRDFYFIERAYKFAVEHRALGIGILGYHTALQRKNIPFESMEARFFNIELSKTIESQSIEASKELAEIFGEPEVMKGTGRRNSTLQAIAPTTSSSTIHGQISQGIEPIHSNFHVKDRAGIKISWKNPILKELLKQKGKDTNEVWESIRINKGSVRGLDFLDKHEKAVFKTFREISQEEIIVQASQRQKYIDQGQSLNLFISPSTPVKEVNRLMIRAWELGLKSLYYQKGVNAAKELNSELEVEQEDNCTFCQ